MGDKVEEDQPVADVMTDKATVELTSPVAGVVTALHGEAGAMVAVKAPLVTLRTGKGTTLAPSVGSADTSPAPRERGEDAVFPAQSARAPSPLPRRGGGGSSEARDGGAKSGGHSAPAHTTRIPDAKPLASPAVRRRAHELGVELQFVPGSGPAGRISHEDLDGYLATGKETGGRTASSGADQRYAQRTDVTDVKVIGLRRKIAQSMQEAKRRIPHFAYIEEVDMTALEELRAHLNATHKGRAKLTVLPFFMRALVKVLPHYPQINARFDDDNGVVHRHAAIHIGIATQTPGGLIVPVVRHAETLDLWQAAAEVSRISTATREGKAKSDELSGSTITLTSLGPLGGIATTPVINYPEVAIVGPNKIVERPVVKGGAVVIRKMMNLSSSFDHRVVDGYDAAEFIQRIKACWKILPRFSSNRPAMIDHITFGVADFAKSTAFYDAAFAPLGLKRLFDVPKEHSEGVEVTGYGKDRPFLWIAEQDATRGKLHIALVASSRDAVNAFHAAALAAGGEDNGAPGLRPHYHPGYYGAFVLDPDGHNIEAVFHGG